MTRAEIYKIRYALYRDLGYSPKDARTLRSRSPYNLEEVEKKEVDKRTKKEKTVIDYEVKQVERVDFTDLVKINKKTGKVIKGKAYRNIRNSMTGPKDITKFVNMAYRVKNDTVYSRWGMLTQDDRYKHDTVKMVKYLQKEHRLTEDQAYYMLYYITTNKIKYAVARQELLSSQEYEMYVPKSKRVKQK